MSSKDDRWYNKAVFKSYDEAEEYAWLELDAATSCPKMDIFKGYKFSGKDTDIEEFAKFIREPNNLGFICKEILNYTIMPFQMVMIEALWNYQFPMIIASRGASKTFTISLYCVLRALLDQGSRIVVVGASLRQSMLLFNYIMTIWNTSPILQDICGGKSKGPKKGLHSATWACGESLITFLPLGDGETIRGLRSSHIICDERASVDQEVFDTVVKGFASVKSTNLVENVKMAAKKKLMARNGMISKEDSLVSSHPTSTNLGGNQIVVAGTASYTFNDFYKNWRQYKAIILSQGDRNVLREHFPDLVGLEGMDSSKYAILRLPYDLVPYGMMDEDILKQGKATTNSTIFNMEYGTIFPDDSDGFYPASSLNACTCPIRIIDQDVDFPARLAGLSDRVYFMGIDPASEHDNFAITIIEHNGLFGSIVYCWTTNRKDFIDKQEKKLAPEGVKDYHSFCIFQIRQLLRRFNIKYILCDAGGGGINVKEGLMDEDKMNPGDVPIFDMDDELHGGKDGAYILKMAQFSDSAWRKNAHYSLKKDFGDRRILFPKFDSSLIAELGTYESEEQLYETLEDVYVDIEKMKQETTHIKARQTENGSESWDVPKMKIHNGQGGKSELKKDRFTSLLLANDIYRFYKDEGKHGINYDFTGLVVGQNKYDQSGEPIKYIGVGARKLKVMGENALSNQVTETSTQNGNIYF